MHARALVVVSSLLLVAVASTGCNKNTLGELPPDISASPSALAFSAGSFQGGATSATMTLVVSNVGSGALRISDVSFDTSASPEFSSHLGGTGTLPMVLGAGDWVAVQVTYTPADAVQDSTVLRITSNDPDEHVVEIPITTPLLGPQLSCTPNPVNFVQAPGNPTSRTVVCSNSGTQPITLTGMDLAAGTSSEFAPAFPLFPHTLAPGQSLDPFQITYTPADLVADAGQVLVHNDAGADYVIDLTGTGTNAPLCDLSAFPFFVGFGSVNLGTTSTKPVILTNNGTADCHVTAVTVAALTTEFSYPGAQSFTVAPNQSHTVSVNYTPTDRVADIGLLAVTSDATNSPAVPLNGVGVGPDIDVLPCPVDFGLVTVGCKVDRQITVYNTGNGPLNVSATTLGTGSNEFSVAAAPPATIAPNASGTATLRLAPMTAGAKSNTVTIHSNDGTTPLFQCALQGMGTASSHQTDTFTQSSSPQADILFVVDNSGSMSANQTTLANSFQSFANYLVMQNVSYHVGITTTDIDPTGQRGKLVGNPKVIDNSTPNAAAKFAQNANVGTDGSGTEQGLEAARLALTEPTLSGSNAGFLRQAARLFIIFVSDEDDQSPDGNSSEPPSYFVDVYKNVKGVNNPDLLSLAAIAGDVPNGCSSAAAGPRYKAAVDLVGGIFGSICQSNFSSTLQQIGLQASAPQMEFFLTRVPVPATIVVKVNGVVQSAGAWTYDSLSNSVTFASGAVPAPGATITIDYDVVCQ